jgi:hypothetical protein
MKFPIHLVPLQKYELTQFDQCTVPCYDHVLIIRGGMPDGDGMDTL